MNGGNDASANDATIAQDDSGGGSDAGAGDATVDAGPQWSIVVSPATATVAAGFSQAYQAKLLFLDGGTMDVTALLTWTTSDAGGATVANDGGDNGLATGVSVGMVSVIATDPNTSLSGMATLTIDGTMITNMIVSPGSATLDAGNTLQFKATGTFSDLSNRDVTRDMQWSTGSNLTATIDHKGLAKGVAPGVTFVEAQNPKVVPDSVTLTVQ
jgi:hypothetical protein